MPTFYEMLMKVGKETFYETLPTYCDQIFKSYAPYDRFPAFWEGLEDDGYDNPYDGDIGQGIAAQAWDRGREARSRCQRMMAKTGN
jgi:hypothetical protein